ncbi:MAG: sugar ABC transporter permease [Chloroflexota bacterium]|nr:sugar ABC transporter permease [Chloroflexota bacterium]
MEKKKRLKRIFTGRSGRKIREALTAYAFIAPSTILIFIFGLFPVGFAIYVSMHKWRIKRGDFIHIQNYVNAIGNLAYIIVFFLGVAALIGAFLLIKHILQMARDNKEKPWLTVIPGLIFAVTTFSLFRWFYSALPEVLDIADKLRGLERSQSLFIQLIREALRAETVLPAWRTFLWLLLASLVVGGLVYWLWRNKRTLEYQSYFALFFLALGAGVGLIYYTFERVGAAYTAAFESGTDPGIWPQFISITAGVILLALAWILWKRAPGRESKASFLVQILAAAALLVGAWLLIGEIPTIVASGDRDLWEGLKVTVFFSLGTVPWQIAIGLFLAVLLFQKVRGANIFRILYFIPYVTPGIASAAVFQQMFSNRQSAPVNMFLSFLGLEPQQWLFEPRGILTILGDTLGFNVPTWAAGPSLALIVIIIHNIWTYVGYDTVIYLAGLGNISKEMTDSAEVDGANRWQVFRHIIFPLLSPTTYFLSLVAIIGTFKAFNTIWIFRSNLALGTTDTFSLIIFIEFFEKLRYGYASALAFILFGIIILLSFINNKTQGSKVFYG